MREPPPSSGSHPHAPSTGGEVWIVSARSTAARSATWPSNWIWIGAATPTVLPSPMFSTLCSWCAGTTVLKELSSGTEVPFSPVAVPDQV